MRKPGWRTSGAALLPRLLRSCRICFLCPFLSVAQWALWGRETHERTDLKRSAAVSSLQRQTEVLRHLGSRGANAIGAAEDFRIGRRLDDLQLNRDLHHFFVVLQYPARPDRNALVRTCRLLRARWVSGDSRHQYH